MQKLTRSLMVVSLSLVMGACSSFGGGDKTEANVGPRPTAIGINGFLWQATLETLSFMPFDTVEPSGGVIVTGWHSTADLPDERVKVTVRFLSAALRSDGLKVSVIRQGRTDGGWQSQPVQAATELQIEEAILTAARRMRVEANS
ncbi:MAG: DUF3576 domain-containing protein [Kordiimonas sp.]